MVRITNGARTTTVTRGAFQEQYKPQGWWEIGSEKQETVETEDLPVQEEKVPEKLSQEPEIVSEESFVPEEDDSPVETPISEMKVKELREYAAQHGIDISRAKNSREIRKIIKASLGE